MLPSYTSLPPAARSLSHRRVLDSSVRDNGYAAPWQRCSSSSPLQPEARRCLLTAGGGTNGARSDTYLTESAQPQSVLWWLLPWQHFRPLPECVRHKVSLIIFTQRITLAEWLAARSPEPPSSTFASTSAPTRSSTLAGFPTAAPRDRRRPSVLCGQ